MLLCFAVELKDLFLFWVGNVDGSFVNRDANGSDQRIALVPFLDCAVTRESPNAFPIAVGHVAMVAGPSETVGVSEWSPGDNRLDRLRFQIDPHDGNVVGRHGP